MDLSILVVNWNTRDLLRCCLESLRAQAIDLGRGGRRAEVIVVDNASQDGSAAMVCEDFPDVRLIANRSNRNYAAATNQALQVSQGEYTLLLNPDTEMPSGSAAALIQFLVDRSNAGAVAPALAHSDGQIQPSVRGFPNPAALLGELTGLARLFPRSRWGAYRRQPEGDQPAQVEQPMASCLLLRRLAIEAIGLIDEQFPLFFNDVDLCYRLRRAGWEIWYEPRVRVLHHGGAATRQVRPRAVWESHQGLRRFYRKHYRPRMSAPAYAAVAVLILGGGCLRAGWAWLRDMR